MTCRRFLAWAMVIYLAWLVWVAWLVWLEILPL